MNKTKWSNELGCFIPQKADVHDGRVFLKRFAPGRIDDGAEVAMAYQEELKPLTVCGQCGKERRWPKLSAVKICPDCGILPDVVTFVAPVVKIRRRIEDFLRKTDQQTIYELAEHLNIQLSN